MTTVKKRYISWEQMNGYCLEIARQMLRDNWVPELLVGITRGGAIPAVMLSHYLDCKMVGLDVSLRDSNGAESNLWLAEDAAAGKKILIVDDINDTGATINWIVRDWENSTNALINWGRNVRIATVIDNEASRAVYTPQYAGESINKAVNDQWIVFPYENFWMPK